MPDLISLRVAFDHINQSQTMMRRAQSCKTLHLFVHAIQTEGGSGINARETVSDDVDFIGANFLRLSLNASCHLLGSFLNREVG